MKHLISFSFSVFKFHKLISPKSIKMDAFKSTVKRLIFILIESNESTVWNISWNCALLGIQQEEMSNLPANLSSYYA